MIGVTHSLNAYFVVLVVILFHFPINEYRFPNKEKKIKSSHFSEDYAITLRMRLLAILSMKFAGELMSDHIIFHKNRVSHALQSSANHRF